MRTPLRSALLAAALCLSCTGGAELASEETIGTSSNNHNETPSAGETPQPEVTTPGQPPTENQKPPPATEPDAGTQQPAPAGTVLWKSDFPSFPAGKAAPLTPTFENTDYNIYAGSTVSIVEDPVKGRVVRFFGPANQSRDGSQRGEQVPPLTVRSGNTYWVGFDLWVSPSVRVSTTWNSAMQLKSSPTEGSPCVSLDVNAHNEAGLSIGGARGSGAEPPHAIGPVPSGTWTRIVVGIFASSDPTKAWVEVWRDGAQVLAREPWRAVNDAGGKQAGGTLYGNDSGYFKFGVYRGPQGFDDEYKMANMRIATTREAAQ